MGNQGSSSLGAKEKGRVNKSTLSSSDASDLDKVIKCTYDDVVLEPGNLLLDDNNEIDEPELEADQIPAAGGSDSSRFKPKFARKTVKFFKFSDVNNPDLIGEGSFGKVFEGRIQGQIVAIKVFRFPVDLQEARPLISPLMDLNHRNVVKMRGILVNKEFLKSGSVTGIAESPQLVLTHYAEGHLLKFLSNRENPQDYAMLGKLALDIVHGCEYLHRKKVIHGNLAARNIMVEKATSKHSTHYNAKISDYGISRLAKGFGENILATGNKSLPVRWVPKELIMQDKTGTDFTYASDVWSFGVVLWEMWTKGAVPYGASYSSLEVVNFIKAGATPLSIHKPKGCPEHIVDLMNRTFQENPEKRPMFSTLKEEFEHFRQKSKAKKAENSSRELKILAEMKKDEFATECQSKGRNNDFQPDSSTNETGEQKYKKPENTKEQVQTQNIENKLKPGGKYWNSSQQKKPPARSTRVFHARTPANGPNGSGLGRGPPPYSLSPLPNHSSVYSGTGLGPSPLMGPVGGQFPSSFPTGSRVPDINYDNEIKRRQEEIEMFKAQKAASEIQKKAAELADAIQRAAHLGVSTNSTLVNQPTAGNVGTAMSGFPRRSSQVSNRGHGRGKRK